MTDVPPSDPALSDPIATYHAIGRFIFEFSQLEFSLRHYTGVEAGLEGPNFKAIMTHDFAMLCTAALDVLTRSLKHEESKSALKTIITECRRLNDVRVKVAHGLWVPHHEGGTVQHVSRSLKISISVDQAAMRDIIENQPYTAVGIALAVGWLLGRMHRPI